jgi:hypothetical protein
MTQMFNRLVAAAEQIPYPDPVPFIPLSRARQYQIDCLKNDIAWHQAWIRECRIMYKLMELSGNQDGMNTFRASGVLSHEIIASNNQQIMNLMLGGEL